VRLRTATDDDLGEVRALLAANALPHEDVAAHVRDFVVAIDEGMVGVAGLELCGTAALLRSVCVAESARGRGLGRQLCEEVEARARALGIRDLYLLTTTARQFFESRGFALVDRARAPESIRATGEFRSLCPSTAACLHKRLGVSG
jgi:amino-acid N-acetyltransferase